MQSSKFNQALISHFLQTEEKQSIQTILTEVENSSVIDQSGINTPVSDDIVQQMPGDDVSDLPNSEDSELTPQKRVQLVQAIINALFLNKPDLSAVDPISSELSSLTKANVDLSNVADVESKVLGIINSLKIPETKSSI